MDETTIVWYFWYFFPLGKTSKLFILIEGNHIKCRFRHKRSLFHLLLSLHLLLQPPKLDSYRRLIIKYAIFFVIFNSLIWFVSFPSPTRGAVVMQLCRALIQSTFIFMTMHPICALTHPEWALHQGKGEKSLAGQVNLTLKPLNANPSRSLRSHRALK